MIVTEKRHAAAAASSHYRYIALASPLHCRFVTVTEERHEVAAADGAVLQRAGR